MDAATATRGLAKAFRGLSAALRGVRPSRVSRGSAPAAARGDAGTLADRILRGQEPALLDALARKLKGRV